MQINLRGFLKFGGTVFFGVLVCVFSLFIAFSVFPSSDSMRTAFVYAQEEDDESDEEHIKELQEKIEEYEKKLDKLGATRNTLASEIEYADSQINLTQLRIQSAIAEINEKTRQIEKLEGDISNLAERIAKLVKTIDYQEEVLGERKRAMYKLDESTPSEVELLMFFMKPTSLDQKLQRQMYSRVMQKRDSELLETMNNTKDTYDRQKDLFEETKEKEQELKQELEWQRSSLEGYKVELEAQKKSKEQLLKDTKNDEAEYQKLLKEAKEELDSYAAFVSAAGGGVIGPNGLGGGEEGWYYSQRDSRWADDHIGNSSYTIFESGCLVTSVAMLHKYYGYDVEPDDIADHDDYFIFGNMRIPWPAPSGRSYQLLSWGYDEEKIDDALDDDNPVIVGVHAANSAGTHFLVLTEKDDGEYIMHDPWYGPDLDFSDYYSTGLIFEAVVFK